MTNTIVTYDLGNSNPHLGLYVGGELKTITPQDKFFSKYLKNDWKDWTFVISQVGKENEFSSQISASREIFTVKKFRKNNLIGDMPIHYQESLGDDRLIQSFYLYKNSNAKNILLIDAGTFITFDFINRSDCKGFLGGYIFPGIKSFLKSYEKGAKLPFLDHQEIPWENNSIPETTNEAILSATRIYIESVLKYIDKSLRDDFEIVITGGDSQKILNILMKFSNKSLKTKPELIHHALFFAYQSLGEKL
jgi:type III pantothenate kinase